MNIPKRVLWIIIALLITLLITETYLCREQLSNVIEYYKEKIVEIYEDYMRRDEVRNEMSEFLNSDVPKNTIAIFEPNPYHHECMPGYAKYFTDLGYNVDVLITENCEDSMEFFEPKDKLRIFTFKNFDYIRCIHSDLSKKFSQYDNVLLHSSDPYRRNIMRKMGFHSNPHSIFVVHDTSFIKEFGIEKFQEKNQIFSLGDFGKCLYVNPHYFGSRYKHVKNKKTKFFITSTYGRKYTQLVETAKELKNKNMDFEITVVGRSTTFSSNDIPNNLKNNFIFKHGLPYKEMFEEVQKSDYILMLLDPDNEYDNVFKTSRVTGTSQLAYGFSKPVIVHKEFADFYKFSSKNAFIYENDNLTKSFENAINLKQQQYTIMQNNVAILANDIYNQSLENVKKAISK